MSTEVVMPQMGESIAEGTIVRWIKKVGDKVDRDEPLFEISTDKVDAEIPSPAAGVLTEIKVKEGETVAVNSVVATIGETMAASAPAPSAPKTPPPPAAQQPPPPSPQGDGSPRAMSAPEAHAPAPQPVAAPAREAVRPEQAEPPTPQAPSSLDEARRKRSSPLVRKIAKEHDVDISEIQGSGIGGRVTKHDILDYLQRAETREAPTPAPPVGSPAAPAHGEPAIERLEREVVPMSVMRKRIAEHMVLSKRTSAHVHSVFEVNFSRVDQIRREKKEEFERAGTRLTFMSFITSAVVDALRAMPVINASIDGDNVVYKREINIGIAVALDWGLIVPVVKHADEKNLLGLSRAIADLANRARAKQLKPEEVQGGTFTITNPGVFGALFGMPIINQPQVAILGVGNIEKRPVVIDDAIAIRPMAYLTLGYDHRLIDGAVADQFMSRVKTTLENWDPAAM